MVIAIILAIMVKFDYRIRYL